MALLSTACVTALEAAFPPNVLTSDPATLKTYGRDWTRVFAPHPALVCFPRHTADVSRLLGIASEHRVGVVPSGGRTGLAAGAVARHGEIVLAMEALNDLGPVDTVGQTVRVGARAVTETVHRHAAAHGLTWPVDFASKGSSQVGGNIATNAGGIHVIRYGLTRPWVLGLEVVLASGEVLQTGGPLVKNNTGLSLTDLFVGTEGTLGVVTAATLKLTALPGELQTMLFAVNQLQHVLHIFSAAQRSGFAIMACEFFDAACLQRLLSHRSLPAPFESPSPYNLLLEFEHISSEEAAAWAAQVFEHAWATDGVVARTRAQARSLWALRESISESLSATGLPHKNDIALPLANLQPFCQDLAKFFAKTYPGWEICLFGHIGDGNLHLNVMKPVDMGHEAFLEHTRQADHAIFALVKLHQGSISAEHGIGLLKKPYLHYSRSPSELALMRSIKGTLDPHQILNPGKIFDMKDARLV